MSIQARCPSCRRPVKVPDIAAGRNVRCPKCYSSIPIPGGSNYASGSAIRRIKAIFGMK